MGCSRLGVYITYYKDQGIIIDLKFIFETELELERARESQLCYSDAHCL